MQHADTNFIYFITAFQGTAAMYPSMHWVEETKVHHRFNSLLLSLIYGHRIIFARTEILI